MTEKQHGGARPATRPDDKRLITKLDNPKAVTIWLEKEHHDQLTSRYGRNWQDVLRQLVAEHLAARQAAESEW